MSHNVFRFELLWIFVLTFCAYECSDCPNYCKCYGVTVDCDLSVIDIIKDPAVPNGTQHVILHNWGWNILTWDSVTHLELHDTEYSALNRPILQLTNLTSLKIYERRFLTGNFGIFEKQSQLGLKKLHFYGTKNLSFSDVAYWLRESRFSTIEELVLDRISSDNDDRVLSIPSSFFTALSTKTEFRRLYLTNLNLNSIDILATRCPPKFNHLSVRGSVIDSVKHYNTSKTSVCKTLKTLDASKTTFRQISARLKEDTYFFNGYFTGELLQVSLYKYFSNVENVLLNNMNKIPIVVSGVIYNFSSDMFGLRRIEMSENRIQFVNATYISHSQIGIEEVNASFNILEYINPSFFYHANFVRKLDLQSNRLYKMQTDFPFEFENFFQRLSSLRYLDLSNNQLKVIPQATFSKHRELRHLNLKYNQLTTISFSLASCGNLEYLNLVGNMIHFHDINSVEPLNEVVMMVRINMGENSKNNTPEAVLKVDLSGNSFSCSCENTEMQTWMVVNSDVLINNASQGYMCTFDGKEYNFTKDQVNELSSICYNRLVLLVSLPSTGGIILILALVIFVKVRNIIRSHRVRKLLRRLQQDEFPLEFLVFISHCSGDDELFMSYILPQLSKSMKHVINTDRDYICVGDQHFRLGHVIVGEIMRSIQQSAVVVLLVSNRYIKSHWCDTEAKEAETQGKPIVLILTEEIDEKEMTPVLKKIFNRNTRFKCFTNEDGQHVVMPTWDVLSKSIIELASVQVNV